MTNKATNSDRSLPTRQAIAVILSGGNQQVVAAGATVKVPLIEADPGSTVEVQNLLTGKAMKATVVEHGRHPKVTGRLFHNKIRAKRYPRGHRQDYTSLRIDTIQ